MHDLLTTRHYFDDLERVARRDIAQSRRLDRSRNFAELFDDLTTLVATAFSPFGKSGETRLPQKDRF